jgi:hypothetical protein
MATKTDKNPRPPVSSNRKPAPTTSFDFLLGGTDGYFRYQRLIAGGK